MSVPLLQVNDLSVTFSRNGEAIQANRSISLEIRDGGVTGLIGESAAGKSVLARSIVGLNPNAKVAGEVLYGGQNLLDLDQDRLGALRAGEIVLVAQNSLELLDPLLTPASQVRSRIKHALQARASLDGGFAGRRFGRMLEWREEAKEQAQEYIQQVGLGDRDREGIGRLSGGMKQCVAMAQTLGSRPAVVIADEPTTAVDSIFKARLLSMLQGYVEQRRREHAVGVLLITHDFGIIAHYAQSLYVMYAGEIVEILEEWDGASTSVDALAHPYTRALWACAPDPFSARAIQSIPGAVSGDTLESGCGFSERCNRRRGLGEAEQARCQQIHPELCPIHHGHWVQCHYPYTDPLASSTYARAIQTEVPTVLCAKNLTVGVGRTRIVQEVSFALHRGETLGIVGESGSGKTTMVNGILGAPGYRCFPGTVLTFNGRSLLPFPSIFRRQIQAISQITSFFPDHSVVADVLREPLAIQGYFGVGLPDLYRAYLCRMLQEVGLSRLALDHPLGGLSGGERQRLAIARGLIALNLMPEDYADRLLFSGESVDGPKVLVLDEPVTALDVSIQGAILALLDVLQDRYELSYLLICHDLGVVRQFCDRVLVMFAGRLVQVSPSEDLFDPSLPAHPYVERLRDAALPPVRRGLGADDRSVGLGIRSAHEGCPYHDRCLGRDPTCAAWSPVLREIGRSRIACREV